MQSWRAQRAAVLCRADRWPCAERLTTQKIGRNEAPKMSSSTNKLRPSREWPDLKQLQRYSYVSENITRHAKIVLR